MLSSIKEVVKKFKKETIIFVGVSLLLVGIDLLTKWLAYTYLGPGTTIQKSDDLLPYQKGDSIVLIKGFLSLTYLTNNGAAFGVGNNEVWARILFILVSWTVFIGLPIYFVHSLKNKEKISKLYFIVAILVFAGNLGNLIDRTFYWNNPCGVIDFIDISQLIPGFGVFNFADSCLVVGLALLFVSLIIDLFKGNDDKKEKEKKEEVNKSNNENGNTQSN